MIIKPMLAATLDDLSILRYPLIASPKIDGIRCLYIGGSILSRSFKPIPNRYISDTLSGMLLDDMDGELVSGSNFQECTSAVMSRDGQPKFVYWVFDYVDNDIGRPYYARIADLRDIILAWDNSFIKYVKTKLVQNAEELLIFEEKVLSRDAYPYEGIMLRDPNGPYKCGRSTVKQQWLLKLKRFVDSEAEIIGFEEMMHNDNVLEKNELGYAKRSTAKDGKIPAGTLGNFLVRDINSGIKFSCGTGRGLTANLRQEVWDNQDKYMGKFIKYKYQAVGVKVAPRIPVWLGFRDRRDM